jgi:hypothetical protein
LSRKCGRLEVAIEKDLQDGTRGGISETPRFLGFPLMVPSQPVFFKKIIESKLARKKFRGEACRKEAQRGSRL